MNILTARFRARGARRFVGYFRTIYGFQRRGICGIIRQLSRRVRFRFVLHIFFSDGLYPYVFRSVLLFFFWNNLISVYNLICIQVFEINYFSRFGVVCDKVFTVLSYSLKPIPRRGFVPRHQQGNTFSNIEHVIIFCQKCNVDVNLTRIHLHQMTD